MLQEIHEKVKKYIAKFDEYILHVKLQPQPVQGSAIKCIHQKAMIHLAIHLAETNLYPSMHLL